MTEAELQAGLDKLNADDPPDYWPSALLANFRHPCMKARIAKRTGRPVSTAIDLKEVYLTRWEESVPLIDPDDEFAMIYRQGTCKSCGQVARSKTGRFVRTAERPPVYGRVSRA